MAKKLNAEQIEAIEYLAMPKRNGLTYAQIAEKVGVDERTLYNWRQEDVFHNALNRRIVRSLSDRLPEMINSVPDHVINDGNAALFRTAMQALGLLTDKIEIDANGGTSDIADIKAQIASMKAVGNRKDE